MWVCRKKESNSSLGIQTNKETGLRGYPLVHHEYHMPVLHQWDPCWAFLVAQ